MQGQGWEFQKKKMHYFTQKGWVPNHFKIKNNVSAILKLRQKKMIEQTNPQEMRRTAQIPRKSLQFYRQTKPSTASRTTKSNMKVFQADENNLNLSIDEPISIHTSSNFKTSVNYRRQMMFMRPYMKGRNNSMTIEERKSEMYQQINSEQLNNLSLPFKNTCLVEYLTEYTDLEEPNCQKKSRGGSRSHKTNINVLKQKLKKRYQLSFYQAKMKI